MVEQVKKLRDPIESLAACRFILHGNQDAHRLAQGVFRMVQGVDQVQEPVLCRLSPVLGAIEPYLRGGNRKLAGFRVEPRVLQDTILGQGLEHATDAIGRVLDQLALVVLEARLDITRRLGELEGDFRQRK